MQSDSLGCAEPLPSSTLTLLGAEVPTCAHRQITGVRGKGQQFQTQAMRGTPLGSPGHRAGIGLGAPPASPVQHSWHMGLWPQWPSSDKQASCAHLRPQESPNCQPRWPPGPGPAANSGCCPITEARDTCCFCCLDRQGIAWIMNISLQVTGDRCHQTSAPDYNNMVLTLLRKATKIENSILLF